MTSSQRHRPGRSLDRKDISSRVKKLVVRALSLQIDPEEIPDDEGLFGDGFSLDSVATLQLVVAVEEEFGFEIDDEDLRLELFASVDKLTDYVERKLL